MTPTQAKKDCSARLAAADVTVTRIQARSIGMTDLARTTVVCLYLHGAKFKPGWEDHFACIPKPSAGGYLTLVGGQCTLDGKPILVT